MSKKMVILRGLVKSGEFYARTGKRLAKSKRMG